MKSNPLGFRIIPSSIQPDDNSNLGVTVETIPERSDKEKNDWRLVGFYTNRAPVANDELEIMAPCGTTIELLPVEWKDRAFLITDTHKLLPDTLHAEVGKCGSHLGYMCNQSSWPNALFSPLFEVNSAGKLSFSSTNVSIYLSPKTTGSEELLVSYDGNFEDNTENNHLMYCAPPTERELTKYTNWLESSTFHFKKDGDLYAYQDIEKVKRHEDLLIQLFGSAKNEQQIEQIRQKHLTYGFHNTRVKHLLSNTWLNLYLKAYFSNQKRTDILATMTTLHSIKPWESCYEADRKAITAIHRIKDHEKLLLNKQFDPLYQTVYVTRSGVKHYPTSLASAHTNKILNKIRGTFSLFHLQILAIADNTPIRKKKLDYLSKILDCIEASVIYKRLDSRPYSIDLVKIIKSIIRAYDRKNTTAAQILKKAETLIQAMMQKTFKPATMATDIAQLITESLCNPMYKNAVTQLNHALIDQVLIANLTTAQRLSIKGVTPPTNSKIQAKKTTGLTLKSGFLNKKDHNKATAKSVKPKARPTTQSTGTLQMKKGFLKCKTP